MTFDPDAPVTGNGIFGLPYTVEESRIVIVPVPFDATTSFRKGTAGAPRAILEASKRQGDLYRHLKPHHPYKAGIAMLPIPQQIAGWNRIANSATMNALGEKVNIWVRNTVSGLLDDEKLPIVLGGDHSAAYGAIAEAIYRHPKLGILHIDAHADLRESYEGFRWSHASIFYNVMRFLRPERLVQVGVRDLGQSEAKLIDEDTRIRTYFDDDVSARVLAGESFRAIADEIVACLPQEVYLSFDIDGLDPTLCPNTGTPVPGGLLWREMRALFDALERSEKRVVGMDLCEVGSQEIDARIAVDVLYEMLALCPAARTMRE